MNQLEPSWAEGYPGGLAGVGWLQLATYPQSPFFRAGVLLRRSVPVPGILETHRPGAPPPNAERRTPNAKRRLHPRCRRSLMLSPP